MESIISRRFSGISLIQFAIPSMLMMICMSLYTIVDGIFVSHFVGSNALSAINIVWPVMNIIIAMGLMIGTGGNAIISKLQGEGNPIKGNEIFTFIVFVAIAIGTAVAIASNVWTESISRLLGANEVLLDDAKAYLSTMALFAPVSMLQIMFQSLFVTAGQPRLGMMLTMAAGLANIILDYLFIVLFKMGVIGAALATGLGQMIPALVGLIFFSNQTRSVHFTLWTLHIRAFLKVCYNGVSEMVSQVSTAIVTFMFNIILIGMAGPDGVAAITAILYAHFIFVSLFIGFTMGVAPIFGYFYGAQDYGEIQRLYKICRRFAIITSLALFGVAWLGVDTIMGFFFQPGAEVYYLSKDGFVIYSVAYLFSGVSIFISGVFTALSDGKTSAIISAMRTFVCIVIALLVLPKLWGLFGVWVAVPIAEAITIVMALYFGYSKLPRPSGDVGGDG